MRKFFYFLILSMFLTVSFISFNLYSYAEEVTLDLESTLNKLITAIENNDYDSFVENGNDEFKAGLTDQMFDGVSGIMSARFKNGYTLDYLGELNQQGYFVHLWKAVFDDKGDDVLIKLSIKDAKVAGFWLQ